MRIGLDVMGGDFAPQAALEGAILASKELPSHIRLVLIGDEKLIVDFISLNTSLLSVFDIIPSLSVIGMGEHPTKAYSRKPDSSIALGFKLLKENKIDAFSSAGNTGAMLVGSMYTINTIPGVIRPCVTSILPKEDGSVNIILDVGANADCKPDVLYQFGILGSLYAKHVFNIKEPKVGLLNIGEEEEKGNILAQSTHHLMKSSGDFKFVGNIEGRDLFGDKADVIVCDGFTGNVVLKEAEAFYSLFKRRKISDVYFDKFNYENYGGSPILGINSTVVVGHGISNSIAIKNMILLAKDITEARLSLKINQALNHN
jgi:glycerol-3-phosphate acyltransferase PlsX